MRWPSGTMTQHINRALQNVALPGFNRTGRARWNLEAPLHRDGFYITVGKTTHKYGRSVHSGAYLTHYVSGVLLVWENGQLMGSQVIWKCNSRTLNFRLSDSPGSLLCKHCLVALVPTIRLTREMTRMDLSAAQDAEV